MTRSITASSVLWPCLPAACIGKFAVNPVSIHQTCGQSSSQFGDLLIPSSSKVGCATRSQSHSGNRERSACELFATRSEDVASGKRSDLIYCLSMMIASHRRPLTLITTMGPGCAAAMISSAVGDRRNRENPSWSRILRTRCSNSS